MTGIKGKSDRRMGPTGSENWHAMLDGAEDILREDGHAELTSRRVAERVGVKQRLVYYYFSTMDELIVETFRRLSIRELDRLKEISRGDQPLREIWEVSSRSTDARLISEFMALANHIDDLKQEVIKFIEETRTLQVEAINAAMERRSMPGTLPAPAIALMAASIGLLVNREQQLGVSFGHDEILAIVEQFVTRLEG
jgi:AcrR family transcriptional regulator